MLRTQTPTSGEGWTITLQQTRAAGLEKHSTETCYETWANAGATADQEKFADNVAEIVRATLIGYYYGAEKK